MRNRLIAEKGHSDDGLPCRQTIGDVWNRLGYRLRKRSKAGH
ncbi:MAG: hypothetical protein ACFB0C_06525 [Leptolyngbyaceae cyanobacterium]